MKRKKNKSNGVIVTQKRAEIRKKRKEEVYTLMLRGIPQRIIAQKMNMTQRLVERDIHEIRKEIGTQLEKVDYMSRVADYHQRQMSRIKKLYQIILDSKSDNKQILEAVKALRKEDEHSLKKDQSVGLLPKEQSPLISLEANPEGEGRTNVMVNIIQPTEPGKQKNKIVKKEIITIKKPDKDKNEKR